MTPVSVGAPPDLVMFNVVVASSAAIASIFECGCKKASKKVAEKPNPRAVRASLLLIEEGNGLDSLSLLTDLDEESEDLIKCGTGLNKGSAGIIRNQEMVQFSSIFAGFTKSIAIRNGRKSKHDVGKEVADAMAKEAKKNEMMLTSSGCVDGGSENLAAVFSKGGNKGINQDRFIVWEDFGCQDDMIFCGVFDGHGPWGHLVAKRVRELMPPALLHNWQKWVANDMDGDGVGIDRSSFQFDIWKQSYFETCSIIDQELVRQVKPDPVIFFIFFLAGSWRDRGGLGTGSGRGRAVPDEPGVYRVWMPTIGGPGLAISRAFGDYYIKDFGLISEPELTYRNITHRDQFAILATDGVWDVMSNKEAVEIVSSTPEREEAAMMLVESSICAWKRKRRGVPMDDISTICLFFHIIPPSKQQHYPTPDLQLLLFPVLSLHTSISLSPEIAQQMEKPRVTEIQVRMDCNGCVQKIKKALHGIHGIHDLYIDFPQQKITIVGSADPEKIVKAIKKTRKSAIVCSHIEQADPPTEPEEPAPAESEAPPPESSNHPPEAPPAEEPPTEPPKDPPTQENQPAEEKQTHRVLTTPKANQTNPVEEVHVIYHYPPDYGHRYNFSQGMSSHEPPRDHGYRYNYGQNVIHEPPQDHRYSRYNYGQSMSQEPPRDHGYNRYNYGQSMSQEPPRDHGYSRYNYGQSMSQEPPRDHGYRYNYSQSMIHEPPQGEYGFRNNHARPIGPEFRTEVPPPGQSPVNVTHSYNSYQPSPYVTGYEYIRSPPRYTQYTRPEHYSEDYHYGNNGNGTISSVFSDESPNACTIA
ncbi:hypothetical protein K7X08_030436 [Anisodus acutangulus]|uniref:Uncharacterized protein n=1 Tax=Anisodus acutangulus TaxID=402998 RepID=A0A9Q1QXA9_9SOLA|nr:hypothetical protein K7X08_030436 [Anisodus acutangulus]